MTERAITIRLNGEQRSVRAENLLELLKVLDLDPQTVVVEHNRQIVRRPGLQSAELHEDDEVELVHFVGGG